MVRGQPLSLKKLLKCNPEQRTEMLSDNFGITDYELQSIWSLPLKERVIPAAELLYEKTGRSESITSPNVSAIVYEDWKGRYHMFKGGHLISDLMKPLKDGIDTVITKRHKITYTQLLRDSVIGSNNTKEVINASKEWDKFKLSMIDWQRRLLIPYQITPDCAQLLGIYWGDGNASNYPYTIGLNGNSDDFDFYRKKVSSFIKRVHHLEIPVGTKTHQTTLRGKNYYSECPAINVNSI